MAGRSAGAARWGVLRSLGLALRAATRPGAPGVTERLAAMPRMVRAAMRGDYRGITLGRLLGMLGAIVYVVSPVDLVPEAVFSVFGLADDAMLVAWLVGALVTDTDAFLAWERGVGRSGASASAGAAGPQDAPDAAQDTVRSHVVS